MVWFLRLRFISLHIQQLFLEYCDLMMHLLDRSLLFLDKLILLSDCLLLNLYLCLQSVYSAWFDAWVKVRADSLLVHITHFFEFLKGTRREATCIAK